MSRDHFFVLLKLALLSQKMKIRKHTILVQNKRLVVPQNQLLLYKSEKKKISEQSFFKKNYGSGGALKYNITRLTRVVSKSGFRCFAP